MILVKWSILKHFNIIVKFEMRIKTHVKMEKCQFSQVVSQLDKNLFDSYSQKYFYLLETFQQLWKGKRFFKQLKNCYVDDALND